jgi:hypothetical protein
MTEKENVILVNIYLTENKIESRQGSPLTFLRIPLFVACRRMSEFYIKCDLFLSFTVGW